MSCPAVSRIGSLSAIESPSLLASLPENLLDTTLSGFQELPSARYWDPRWSRLSNCQVKMRVHKSSFLFNELAASPAERRRNH
jgi:hypothetical protein